MNFLVAAALPLLLAGCQAQFSRGMTMPQDSGPAGQATQVPLPLVNAEIEEVDVDAGTVTLAHEAIPNLNMPPMTMVFATRDKEMLKGLKAGDRIRARFNTVRGQMMLTEVERAR